MKKLFKANELDTQTIQHIMSKLKPTQMEKIFLHAERVRKLISKSVPFEKTEDFVCKALEHYAKYLQAHR